MFKALPGKKSAKNDRLHKVLIGLVEHFIKTGKPVGSHTLQESGYEEMSSATIRNYFVQLETDGYLSQQHASGGRIPTHLAYREYAKACEENYAPIDKEIEKQLAHLKEVQTREIALVLQQAAEWLSQTTGCGVFLSAPRFDQDFILDMKIVDIDSTRCLVIIITDFGVVQTEIVHVDRKLSAFSVKRIDAYFRWRLTGQEKPENMTVEEEQLGQKIYNEIVVRYIVSYSNFIEENVYRTGFSQLLKYQELRDAVILAQSLSLFENAHVMRLLLKECQKGNHLRYWIGQDLKSYSSASTDCAVIAIPYHINQTVAGAVGIVGPMRLPYKQLFGILHRFSETISEALTQIVYKFKIDFRKPAEGIHYIKGPGRQNVLLEDKREGEQ
jgi:heat-inducible transcriptional repressor